MAIAPPLDYSARLVIVDDSLSAAEHLRDLVARNIGHCEWLTFTESARALDFCLGNDVDLVVVDFLMPPPNGLQFIERYRDCEGRRDVPVIMVTSEQNRDIRYMALQLGATDFLTKPVDDVEFVTRVRNLLALSLHRRSLNDRAAWLAEEVAKATSSLVERERETVLFLCRAAEHRDPETGSHLRRMATYSRVIALGLGLGHDLADLIHTAAPMHDIGKIGIPDDILLKPGRFTPEEERIMRRHTTVGAAILEGSNSPLLRMAAEIALHHHERMDGSGYPQGLAGVAIPLVGRITALADVFDALTSIRPYKPAWPVDQARDYILSLNGIHFDAACVDALLGRWDDVLRVMAKDR